MRTNKGLYGFFAFGPLAIGVLAVIGMAAMIAEMNRHSVYNEPSTAMFFFFVSLIFVASILSLVSMIMFIIHISKNPHVPEGSRIAWIIGMVLANGITQLIYFFVYITKENELEADRRARENYNPNTNFGQSGPGRNPFE